MNYVEEINKAVLLANWVEVSRLALLANEEKYHGENESYFGIKKGYINLIKCNFYTLNDLKDNDIRLMECYSQADVNRSIKEGQINNELINNNFVILFYTKDNVVTRLIKLGYKLQHFSLATRFSKKIDASRHTVKNLQTGIKTVFRNTSELIALEREKKIDKIFKD